MFSFEKSQTRKKTKRKTTTRKMTVGTKATRNERFAFFAEHGT